MRLLSRYRPELAVSEDESRPALNHVYYDADGGLLYASDSFIAVKVPVESLDDGDTSGVVPIAALDAARRYGHHIKLNAGATVDGFATFVRPDTKTTLETMIDKVIPNGTPLVTVGFDLELLTRAARALGGGKFTLQFYPGVNGGTEQPILLTRLDDDAAVAVVMPIRLAKDRRE